MKKIKIAIMLIIIIIIILIIAILSINSNNYINISNDSKNVTSIENYMQLTPEELEDESRQGVVGEVKKQEIINESDYITLEKCILDFMNRINKNSSIYFGRQGKIVSDQEINNISLQLLSENYINKNYINLDNIDEFIYAINKDVLFVPVKIRKFYKLERVNSFVIEGFLEDREYNNIMKIMLILNLDTTNNTYSIEILNNNQDINSITPSKLDQIDINDYNTYEYMQITEENIIKEITYLYKKTILGYPEIFYNNYLNSDYKKQKFKNLEEFKSYVERNKSLLQKIEVKKYDKVENNDNTIYILEDQYENIFMVSYNTIVNYKVYLDNYTIELNKFKEQYNEANEEAKIYYNIDKVRQMFNFKDYESIYNKLNTTFRNNNFSNISELEKYLKSSIYNINFIEVNNSTKNDEYYVCECTLKNQENSSESKNMTIIMKLIDSNNFEMSFSF